MLGFHPSWVNTQKTLADFMLVLIAPMMGWEPKMADSTRPPWSTLIVQSSPLTLIEPWLMMSFVGDQVMLQRILLVARASAIAQTTKDGLHNAFCRLLQVEEAICTKAGRDLLERLRKDLEKLALPSYLEVNSHEGILRIDEWLQAKGLEKVRSLWRWKGGMLVKVCTLSWASKS